MRKIEFDAPAANWNEALPIGNGRLGAMIFGAMGREQIQLNADSIWYGGPQERCNEHAKEYLPQIRKLILEDGNIAEAQRLMTFALSGTPQSERPYQTAGNLWLDWGWGYPAAEEYRRALNLEEGVVTAEYRTKDNTVTKEYFASYPAGVIVIRLSSGQPGGLKFTAMMDRGRFYDGTGSLGTNGVKLWGNTGEGGVKFLIGLKADVTGKDARMKVIGEHLIVENADEAVLYLAIETSFYEGQMHAAGVSHTKSSSDGSGYGSLETAALEKLDRAIAHGYEKVRAEHVNDYRSMYSRVDFSLGGENEDEKLRYVTDYFQFVRYLTISASRPGSLPSNLQGIWNDSMTPAWDSKYTININTEMNYWPTEGANLSECHLPLFDLLKRMRERGSVVAEKMYGCRGFVAHHNTDIWADCAPQDIYLPATYWVMGAAWLSTHIWTHYMYTLDRAFLEDMYPVLQDVVLFFHDFLVEYHGTYVTCPSVSPENTYILPSGMSGCVCAGPTMDTQILTDLFLCYLKASEILGVEDEETARTKEILEKLPKPKIGKHGQLVEWWDDYEEQEPGHRHISHLYGLHPSHQISPDQTPGLAKAAEKTLERRLAAGGGHTGWSCAWIINMYARLGNGEEAWNNLQKMYEKSTFKNRLSNHPMGPGFVFQIDGNFGAASGIIEMLLQSSEERTLLLPALPDAWADGSVKGLVMYGGATVDMEWKNKKLTACTLHGHREYKTTICWEGAWKEVHFAPGITVDLLN